MSNSIVVSKEDAQGIVYHEIEGSEIVEDKIIGTTRWSNIHEVIFQWVDGGFYETSYSEGATEMQDESAFEYDEDAIECNEVGLGTV